MSSTSVDAVSRTGRDGGPDPATGRVTPSPRPPRRELHAPGSIVLAGREEIFVRRAGTPGAPPAVLVHGLGGSSGNWAELAYELSDDADIHVIDLPGYGGSPTSVTGRHDLAVMTDVVEAYLEQVGPAHLLGNSMGGLLSVLVAGKRPDLVRSLTLVSPAMPQWWIPPGARLVALLALPWLGARLLEAGTRAPLERQIDFGVHDLFGDPSRATDELREDWISERRSRIAQPHLVPVFVSSARSILAEVARPPRVWRAARRFPGPTLVIIGLRDRLVHHSTGTTWERLVPWARVVRMPTTGHVAQIEHPELVRSFVVDLWSNDPLADTGG